MFTSSIYDTQAQSFAVDEATVVSLISDINEYTQLRDLTSPIILGYIKPESAIHATDSTSYTISALALSEAVMYVKTIDYNRELDFGVILAAFAREVTITNNSGVPATVTSIAFNSNFGIVVSGIAVNDVIDGYDNLLFTITAEQVAVFNFVDSFVTITLSTGEVLAIGVEIARSLNVSYSFPPDLESYSESYKLKTSILTFTDGTESRSALTAEYKNAVSYDITFASTYEVQTFVNVYKYAMTLPVPQPLWSNFDILPSLVGQTTLLIDTIGKGYKIGDRVMVHVNSYTSYLPVVVAISDTTLQVDIPITCPTGALIMPTFLGVPGKSMNFNMSYGNFGKASLKITEV